MSVVCVAFLSVTAYCVYRGVVNAPMKLADMESDLKSQVDEIRVAAFRRILNKRVSGLDRDIADLVTRGVRDSSEIVRSIVGGSIPVWLGVDDRSVMMLWMLCKDQSELVRRRASSSLVICSVTSTLARRLLADVIARVPMATIVELGRWIGADRARARATWGNLLDDLSRACCQAIDGQQGVAGDVEGLIYLLLHIAAATLRPDDRLVGMAASVNDRDVQQRLLEQVDERFLSNESVEHLSAIQRMGDVHNARLAEKFMHALTRRK